AKVGGVARGGSDGGWYLSDRRETWGLSHASTRPESPRALTGPAGDEIIAGASGADQPHWSEERWRTWRDPPNLLGSPERRFMPISSRVSWASAPLDGSIASPLPQCHSPSRSRSSIPRSPPGGRC